MSIVTAERGREYARMRSALLRSAKVLIITPAIPDLLSTTYSYSQVLYESLDHVFQVVNHI